MAEGGKKKNGEKWSSQMFFVLAAIGSAVGLGNIWRLPYTIGMNGGGAFVILYVLAVMLIGFPGLLFELAAGRGLGTGLLEAYRKIAGRMWWLGLLPILMIWVILSYYTVVVGWTLFYFTASLFGVFIPFGEAVSLWWLPVFGFISLLIVEFISRADITKGLEKVNAFLFPVFTLCLLILFGFALTLPGFGEGIAYLTTFSWEDLLVPAIITAAIAQAVFSLSVGEGIMFTYGSYLKKNARLLGSSLSIAFADTLIGLVSATIIFAIVFTFSLAPEAGPSLAFQSLPLAVGGLPFGNILLAVFFLLLFSVAVTSAISMSELLISNIKPHVGNTRHRASIVQLGLTLLLFVPAALTYSPVGLELFGMPFFDLLDQKIAGMFLPAVVAVFLGSLAWMWKDARGALRSVAPELLADAVYFIAKYVLPVLILALFITEMA